MPPPPPNSAQRSDSGPVFTDEDLWRRTKVLATLGPATDPPEVMQDLVDAGVNAVRINLAHGSRDEHRSRVTAAREAAAAAGRAIGVVLDLQGPKVRLGQAIEPREVARDELITFVAGEAAPGEISVDWATVARGAEIERSQIAIGDGSPRFVVVDVSDDGNRVVGRCVMPGTIQPRKGINVTYSDASGPALTEKDLVDLDLIVEVDADFVALSFVRGPEDVELLRSELEARGSKARVIAKIERLEAVERLGEIVMAADGVMVARGDLGVEAGVARVALLQKQIIDKAKQAGRLCITATQMLESMIDAPEPTRAEALDVANAVLDGTSAVMLSAESAMGRDPGAVVRAMAEIASEAESSEDIYAIDLDNPEVGVAAIMKAAVLLGRDTGAGLLLVPTASGGSARACAKYRPERPIVALARDRRIAAQLTLDWGIVPGVLEDADGIDDLVGTSLAAARRLTGLSDETTVVLTAGGVMTGEEDTNVIVVKRLGDDR
jgi:pyruvate kinase